MRITLSNNQKAINGKIIVSIKDYIKAYPEDEKTKKTMDIGLTIREQGYARMEQLLELVKWKFPIAIRHVNFPNNSEDDVKVLTSLALNESYLDSTRIRFLLGLNGVKIRMASAILTLIFPNSFGTFDVNARNALEHLDLIKKDELSKFKLQDYLSYLMLIRKISEHIHCSPRDVDRALYYYGRHLKNQCHIDGNCPICLKKKIMK